MDTMEAYREVIKENIEYDILRQQLGYNADLLDDILDIMVDTVCSSKRMIRIHTTRDCRIRCFPCARATRRRSSTRTATVTAA